MATKNNAWSGLGHCGRWMVTLFLAGGAVFLFWPEYRPQLLNALPFLILLLCPLMHLFMHRGHGKQHHGDHDRS